MSKQITAKAKAESLEKAKKLTWLPREVYEDLIELIELDLYAQIGSLLWPMAMYGNKEARKAFNAIMACFDKTQQERLG